MSRDPTADLLRNILAQDLRSRVEQRAEFFEIAMKGIQQHKQQLTSWVAGEILWGVAIDPFDIERIVGDIEFLALTHLLFQLQGESQAQAYNLAEGETLVRYCKRVAIRDNKPRDARNALTVQQVPKNSSPNEQAESTSFRILARRLYPQGYDTDGRPNALPAYMTEGVSAPVPIEEMST